MMRIKRNGEKVLHLMQEMRLMDMNREQNTIKLDKTPQCY